jgi:tryptophan-rich sensory protein
LAAIADPLLQGIGLVASFAATFAAAAVGSRSTMSSVNGWYADLRKPNWVPSGRTIGLVWSTLYVLMAIAGWLVWREQGLDAWLPLALFGLQLALNALWSVLFFGRRKPGTAFVEIWLLWAAILATLVSFWTVSPLAGLLLVPYLAWVTFAGNLNRVVWRMNPEVG